MPRQPCCFCFLVSENVERFLFFIAGMLPCFCLQKHFQVSVPETFLCSHLWEHVAGQAGACTSYCSRVFVYGNVSVFSSAKNVSMFPSLRNVSVFLCCYVRRMWYDVIFYRHIGPKTIRTRDTSAPVPKCLRTVRHQDISVLVPRQSRPWPRHFRPWAWTFWH